LQKQIIKLLALLDKCDPGGMRDPVSERVAASRNLPGNEASILDQGPVSTMKTTAIATALLVAAQIAAANSASAAQCADRNHIVGQLADRYGETLLGSERQKNAVLELFASRRTESWTLMLSTQDGLSCLVASGEGFSKLDRRFRRHTMSGSG